MHLQLSVDRYLDQPLIDTWSMSRLTLNLHIRRYLVYTKPTINLCQDQHLIDSWLIVSQVLTDSMVCLLNPRPTVDDDVN